MKVIIGNRFRSILLSIFCVILLCCSAGLSAIIAEGVTLVPLTDDGKSRAVAWAWHGDWVAFVRQVGDSSQWQLHVMKLSLPARREMCFLPSGPGPATASRMNSPTQLRAKARERPIFMTSARTDPSLFPPRIEETISTPTMGPTGRPTIVTLRTSFAWA